MIDFRGAGSVVGAALAVMSAVSVLFAVAGVMNGDSSGLANLIANAALVSILGMFGITGLGAVVLAKILAPDV